MAHHKSAIKRIRTNEERRQRNKANRTRMRNTIKAYKLLLDEGKLDDAKAALPGVVSHLHKSVTKNLLHRKTASRHVSRLTLALNRQTKEA